MGDANSFATQTMATGLTGLLIATLGTDLFSELQVALIALILLFVGSVGLLLSVAIDIDLIGGDGPKEVSADV